MSRQSDKAERFRALHAGEPFVIPNPWDAGSARMFEALGFEALSRGAAEVVMVDTSRVAYGALRESAAQRGAGDRLKVVHGDALHFIATSGQGGYDVVFVDPPYGSGLASEALARVPRLLARGGVVYIESDSPLALDPPWRARRHGRAGAVLYQLTEWGGHDDGSLSGHV